MIDSILNMYRDVKLGRNEICTECQNEEINKKGFSKPISPWHVGGKFYDNAYKVLFVGKVARGQLYDDVSKHEKHGIINATAFARDALIDPFSAYWSYTREIAERLFGHGYESAIENIAMTNLIKCNNAMHNEGRNYDGTTKDYTTDLMKENCLNRIGVFWKEIDLLMPKNMVVYAHYAYDEYLCPIGVQTRVIKDKEHTQPVGKKKTRWWDRELVMRDGGIVRLLVVSHPERLLKEDFVNKIVSWIKIKLVGRQ